MNKTPFVIVDGSSYLFRAYHALPPLTNSEGLPTGAIYGVLNMLSKLIENYQPENMVVVFDTKEPNFRHEIFPEYKANRTIMPDDLAAQIEPLYELIEAMGIPLLFVPGLEADDIIGTLAKQAKSKVIISTGDKDMAQLVNDDITLVNTMSDKIMDEEEVVNKFGVKPNQIIDFLALTGDTVDNIPGVPKVGPKTAAKWLNEYENLDKIIENAASIKGKVGENLKDSIEKLPLYRELTTIKTDLDLKTSVDELTLYQKDNEKLIELFTKFGFKQWLNKVESTPKEVDTTYQTISTEKELKNLIKLLEENNSFAFDTETDSLDALTANLVGMSFSVEENIAFYIPLNHSEGNQLPINQTLKAIKPILANSNKTIIGHNLKYDILVLKKYAIEIECKIYDTMLASYIYNSINKHDLDSVSQNYLRIKTISYDEITKTGKTQITFNEVNIETATKYAAEDADIALKLFNFFTKEMKETKQETVLNEIEFPLVKVLSKMEYIGILIDKALLNKQSEEINNLLDKIKEKVFGIAKEEFNLNSPKQLQEILFEKLKLPVLQKTPKGAPSTSEGALQELIEYPIIESILEYRTLAKLKSTYTDKLPEETKEDGRVHTSFQQAVTSTGRLSSTNPNLQNIPIRTERGKDVRAAFIPKPGYVIMSADYSQIELRIMAHLSEDEQLISAFNNNQDIHKKTAAEIFNLDMDKVTANQRSSAKAINFGLIYGMSSFGLSKQLKIEVEEADSYIKNYFNNFPKVHEFMENIKTNAKKQGYVETLFGRKLLLPNIKSKNFHLRQAAERAAINAPMQGSNADIIKKAMITIQDWIEKENINASMILQVHDELIFEIEESILDEVTQKIKSFMESVTTLSVPLLVETGFGKNWKEAH